MLELRLPAPDFTEAQALRIRRIAGQIEKVRRSMGSRIANQALFDKVGFILENRDESYFQEALDYHLGLLYARANEPERAAKHLERSHTLAGSGGNKIFSDHQLESSEIRRRQEQGLARSIPSVVIASMPRSGSASLTQTLASFLDLPVARASTGDFPNYVLVPRWLNVASAGGIVLHDHFSASEFNLKVLRDAGIKHLFVHVRDPRAAAYSVCKLGQQVWGPERAGALEDMLVRIYEHAYIPWLMRWIEIADNKENEICVQWSFYGNRARDISKAARDIVKSLAMMHPPLLPYLDKRIKMVTANLGDANNEAWRDATPPRCQDRLWEATPGVVRDLLAMKPDRKPTRQRVTRMAPPLLAGRQCDVPISQAAD